MRGNWLLLGWACAEIGYFLAEHTRKLVTRWLSIRGNSFLLVLNHVFSPFIPSPVPFSRLLSNILCLLSQVSVPCLLSSVPCLTSLFHVSRPLFPVSRLRSLSPILCSLSHFSMPCFPPFVSHPLFHVSLLCSMSHFFVPCLPSSVPNLTSLFIVSRSLSPILSLCSLYSILLSRQFVALYWFRVCSACDEIVSNYAQCAMNSFPRMLSLRWNSFRVCSECDEIVSAYAQHAFGCPCKNCQIWTLAEHTRKKDHPWRFTIVNIPRILSENYKDFLLLLHTCISGGINTSRQCIHGHYDRNLGVSSTLSDHLENQYYKLEAKTERKRIVGMGLGEGSYFCPCWLERWWCGQCKTSDKVRYPPPPRCGQGWNGEMHNYCSQQYRKELPQGVTRRCRLSYVADQ